ncbi:MAG: M14 family zinc carboxypeptidase [Chloroflexota bacterium]
MHRPSFRPLLILIAFICLVSLPTSTLVSAQEDPQAPLVVDVQYTDLDDLAFFAAKFDVWEVDRELNTLKAMITQADYQQLIAAGYHIEIDLSNAALVNTPLRSLPGQRSGISGYPCYRTVEETYASAESIAANYPELATWSSIGGSWEKETLGGAEGYDLMVLKLTNSAITGDKPKIFIMSALHARELATAELNTRFAEYLIDNYGLNADVTWLLDYHEIHLLLHANPDGRKHAEEGSLWRKNTNEDYCVPTPDDRGADLNRNFPFHWDSGYSSSNECYETYRGPNALSEPESSSISDYVIAQFLDQRGDDDNDPAPDDATGIFIDLHSSGEFVLWPYGFDDASVAPNDTQLQTLGRKLAFFNTYRPEQANFGFFPASGATDDFAYGTLGIAAYTFELGIAYFQDCTSFNNAILPDNLNALLYAAKVARTPYMTPSGPDALNLAVSPYFVAPDHQFTFSVTLDDQRYEHLYGFEPTQIIVDAEYSVDQPFWEAGVTSFPMLPIDGVFDEHEEAVSASISTLGLPLGQHTLFVRGQDEAGNWGAVSAIFFRVEYGAYFPIVSH